jgi:DNA repair REX1-B
MPESMQHFRLLRRLEGEEPSPIRVLDRREPKRRDPATRRQATADRAQIATPPSAAAITPPKSPDEQMDITKCVEILSQRASHNESDGCPCHTALASLRISDDDAAAAAGGGGAASHDGQLSDLGTISLMNLFTALQGERVQAHMDYGRALDTLCAEDRVGEYPILCAEATSRFAVISKKIIAIKELLLARGCTEAAGVVTSVQGLEKEKLTLVAAQHLDKIQDKLPAVAPAMHESMTLMATAATKKYTADQVAAIEAKVTDLLDDFQALKCDIDEDEQT